MGREGLLGLPCLRLYELALQAMVRVWRATAVAGGVEVEAFRGRLDLRDVRKRELRVADVVQLV